MEKKINDLRLEAFINDRQQFGPLKYQLISESLLFDRVNINIIKKCADILSQLDSQNAKDPLTAAIQKTLIIGNPQNINQNENIPAIVVPAQEIFESNKWKQIKKNYIFQKFIRECVEDKGNPRTSEDLQSVFYQITTINLQLSIQESKEIIKEQNREKQKQLILKIIEQQAEGNIDTFLTNFTINQKGPSQAQRQVTININKKQNSIFCDQISKKLTQIHQIEQESDKNKNNQPSTNVSNSQINQNNHPINKDNLPSFTLSSRVDQRQNGIIPAQEYTKLFQNQDQLKKIMELKQKLDSKTQAITYNDIHSIYTHQDSKVVLNEILVTLDLALSINVWNDTLIKYCKSIEEDDNLKEQSLNILESCEQLIQYFEKTIQVSGCQIQYFDFNDNNQQKQYEEYLKDKKNEFPMKYQYEIDKFGIQMFSDNLIGNQNCYISISFTQQEFKVRGVIGQSIIDGADSMMRIYFVLTQEYERTIQTIMSQNDDYTKLLKKCLMILASYIVTSFIKMPVIFKHLQYHKQLNTKIYLPKDNKQIHNLITTIAQ